MTRDGDGVTVRDQAGNSERYDQVVFGCHADEALALLGDADAAEHAALSAIPYQKISPSCTATTSVMPKSKPCWASWVYHADDGGADDQDFSQLLDELPAGH